MNTPAVAFSSHNLGPIFIRLSSRAIYGIGAVLSQEEGRDNLSSLPMKLPNRHSICKALAALRQPEN